jgi:hypothetical protein
MCKYCLAESEAKRPTGSKTKILSKVLLYSRRKSSSAEHIRYRRTRSWRLWVATQTKIAAADLADDDEVPSRQVGTVAGTARRRN